MLKFLSTSSFKSFAHLFSTDATLFILDKRGVVVEVSDNVADLLGFPLEALKGKAIQDYIHPDEQINFLNLLNQASANKQKLYVRCKPKEGKPIGVSWKLHRQGEQIYAVAKSMPEKTALAEQLTLLQQQLVQTEQQLQQREQENQFLCEHRYDVIRHWDLITDNIQWDNSIQVLLGYSQAQGQNSYTWWHSKIHTDDRERVLHSLQRCFEAQSTVWVEEYRLKTANEDYIMVVDRIIIIRDAAHKPLKAIGALFDLKQRKQLDASLQSQQEHFLGATRASSLDELAYQANLVKTITDNTTSSLFMMDAKGHPTFMNPAAEKLTGYTLDEIKDRPLHYAIHYKYPDGRPYPMEECPLDNSSAALVAMQNQQEVFVDKFGRLFPVIWSVAPLERDGKTIGAVIEFRDVTLEKQAENERLAAQVQAEHQLFHAKAAEQNRKQLADFVDYLCHEIRNPAHGIAGNSNLLQDSLAAIKQSVTQLPAPQVTSVLQRLTECKEQADSIQECVNHQTLIINNFLELSRLEAGKVELDDSLFSPQKVVNSAFGIMQAKAKEKALKLISPDLKEKLQVKGDATRLRQIIINLIANAIKFTPENGIIKLSLQAENATENQCKLHFSIEDNGVGMCPEEQQRLFHRFSQANHKISAEYGGSGLGLAICDELVKLMGGAISVSSEKNRGTTFSFFIRCAIPSLEEITSPVKQMRQLAIASAQQRFKQILVVEDNPVNQKLMTRFLEKLGYVCAVASDGKQAVDCYAMDREIDLILMDMLMPVMNGEEATQQIRAIEAREQRPFLPIIAISGNASNEHINAAKTIGIDDYLTKPFTVNQLQTLLNKWEAKNYSATHCTQTNSALQQHGIFAASPIAASSPIGQEEPALTDLLKNLRL